MSRRPSSPPPAGFPERTLRRWRAAYRTGGLAALVRRPRADRCRVKMPEPLRLLIEGLALRPPRRSIAVIHRQAVSVATAQGWPVPSYSTVHTNRASIPFGHRSGATLVHHSGDTPAVPPPCSILGTVGVAAWAWWENAWR
ncbi:helix-turn-helix domain-containing protein [Nonomuraea sp. NPDC049684]|uniref:helix-turn-helix domain-containing protein n=1 Tax=Nonomuraea sp. NPDC049684 TaxID=3364356 RepID=UPI0037AE88A9